MCVWGGGGSNQTTAFLSTTTHQHATKDSPEMSQSGQVSNWPPHWRMLEKDGEEQCIPAFLG